MHEVTGKRPYSHVIPNNSKIDVANNLNVCKFKCSHSMVYILVLIRAYACVHVSALYCVSVISYNTF